MIERIPITSRAEWLAERNNYVGASEVATVCGESSYGSLAALYAVKRGLQPPPEDNAAMRRGRWGEGAAFEALCEERPEWEVRRAAVHVRDTERLLACTPDGFARRPDRDGVGIVQAKVISRSVFRQRWLDDAGDNVEDGAATPPIAYRLQVITEMMLNQLEWGVLAVLINGEFAWAFRLFDIERDEVLEDRIRFHTSEFLRKHLHPGIMPPFDVVRDEALVRALFPADDGSTIDLSTDNRALAAVEELTEVQAAKRRLEASEKALKVELQGKLGEHTYGRLADGRRIAWRQQHRSGYVVEPKDFRVFKVMPK